MVHEVEPVNVYHRREVHRQKHIKVRGQTGGYEDEQ